jgi:chromosome segregation protein
LSAAGKGFDHDLVEKLVGEALKPVRQKIAAAQVQLKSAVENLLAVESDAEEKQEREEQLRDVNFRLEQLDKHGVKAKLEKQVSFNNDITYCETVDELVEDWRSGLDEVVEQAAESFEEFEAHTSKHNAALFKT